MNEIALYLHWPFCKSKCPYCDFASVPMSDDSLYETFGDLLLLDLQRSISPIAPICVKSIFFGGGTPSLMSLQSMEKILNFLAINCYLKDDIEISLEANPATFDRNKMKDFRKVGINRLSLGIQSFRDDNLKFLGRIYGGKQAFEAAEIVAKTFENFSFDFMYGYEGQSPEDFVQDLSEAANFGCKHISCYQLTFEEGTLFYDRMISGTIKKINENEIIEFDDLIEKVLDNYVRYEISNYAIPGFECRHNLAYWRYENYLGVGAGAHSRLIIHEQKYEMEKKRDPFLWKSALEKNESTFSNINRLTEEEQLKEIVIMGLRLLKGIENWKLQSEVIGTFISEKKLKFLREKKLMCPEKFRLTKAGLRKMDAIVEFLLDD